MFEKSMMQHPYRSVKISQIASLPETNVREFLAIEKSENPIIRKVSPSLNLHVLEDYF